MSTADYIRGRAAFTRRHTANDSGINARQVPHYGAQDKVDWAGWDKKENGHVSIKSGNPLTRNWMCALRSVMDVSMVRGLDEKTPQPRATHPIRRVQKSSWDEHTTR